jgi:DNA replication protein DnaC
MSAELKILLRSLRLPTFLELHEEFARRAEAEAWSLEKYLQLLAEAELEERRRRRVLRALKASHLPPLKTLDTLDQKHLSLKVRRRLPTLLSGDFLASAINILLIGLPGRGKTHLASAIGHRLIHQGYRVLFTPTYSLVQRLLAAKRELQLERLIQRLDKFHAVILDDLGYVQQSRDEMEVLFTFLSERYERRSVILTSNLVFSQWDRIFKDKITTAAAIDRLVHHSVILEMTGPTHRGQEAKRRIDAEQTDLQDKLRSGEETSGASSEP